MKDKLSSLADEAGISVSQLTRNILMNFFDQEGPSKIFQEKTLRLLQEILATSFDPSAADQHRERVRYWLENN